MWNELAKFVLLCRHTWKKPDKKIGFTQSSYPAFFVPSDEDYKTHLIVMRVQRWDKSFMCANKLADFFSLFPSTWFIKMTKRQNTYLNTPVFQHAGQFFFRRCPSQRVKKLLFQANLLDNMDLSKKILIRKNLHFRRNQRNFLRKWKDFPPQEPSFSGK